MAQSLHCFSSLAPKQQGPLHTTTAESGWSYAPCSGLQQGWSLLAWNKSKEGSRQGGETSVGEMGERGSWDLRLSAAEVMWKGEEGGIKTA